MDGTLRATAAVLCACSLYACTQPPPVRAERPPDEAAAPRAPAKPATSDAGARPAESAEPPKPASGPVPAPPPPPRPLPVPPAEEPDIRVRIAALAPGTAATVGGGGQRLVVVPVAPDAEGAGASRPAPRMAAPVQASLGASGWSLRDAAGMSISWPAEVTQLRLDAASGPAQVQWNGAQWPGHMRLVRTPAGGIDIVMDVPMERYLPGVIAKELYGSWDLDTFKAQAVAARSYAVVEDDRWSERRHYDVVAGEQSQAWIGETSNPTALQAVRDTRGMVLVHEGRVVPGYYSSACGGRPATARGAITENPHHGIPPLGAGDAGARKGECCQSTKVATWEARVPVKALLERVRAWGRANGRADLAALPGITGIAVKSRNSAGRAVAFSIASGAGAPAEIGAEDLRTAINAAGDRSTSIRSSDCSVRIKAGMAEFEGRGFGHGAGMCQHGAQSMATRGSAWDAILARYYPGARVERAWR